VIISIIVGMVSFYSLKIGIEPVLERFLRIGKETSRLDIWRDSIALIKDHPFGIGLAAFKQVFPVYNVSNYTDVQYLYLHSDYLQLLAEAGWIGFLALTGGFYIFLIKSIFKIQHMHLQSDPLRFFLSIGALSGLVSIAFHSLFDFNLHIPANCVYFVMLIGIVYNCAWRDVEKEGNRKEKIGNREKAGGKKVRRIEGQKVRKWEGRKIGGPSPEIRSREPKKRRGKMNEKAMAPVVSHHSEPVSHHPSLSPQTSSEAILRPNIAQGEIRRPDGYIRYLKKQRSKDFPKTSEEG